jgi:hypothetical protein
MMNKPAFRQVRQLAAEYEAEQLRIQGYDVVVVGRRDPDEVSPANKIPAIFERAELNRYQAEQAAAGVAGIDPSRIAPPSPLLDFGSWRYPAVCPRCSGRRLEVKGVGYIYHRSEVVELDPEAEVKCLRPRVGIASKDCGWSGKVRDLHRRCYTCGEMREGVTDGTCPTPGEGKCG